MMDNANSQSNVKRSAAYPGLSLPDAVEFSLKVNEKFSIANSVTREEIAHVLGLHPNSISRDVAACTQYGLMDRIEGRYKLSNLFADIFRPESESDKKISLIKAFGKPKLFQELIAKFDGFVIPQELTNTLIKHHGITESAAPFAADIFVISGQKVGVINENRVLNYNVSLSTASKVQYAEIVSNPQPEEKGAISVPANVETFVLEAEKETKGKKTVPIYLTGEQTALFIYPNEITEDDIELVRHQIDGVLLRIKLESKRRLEKNTGGEAPVN